MDKPIRTTPNDTLKPIEGLTVEALLEALADFIREDLKDYELPLKRAEKGEKARRAVTVDILTPEDSDDEDELIPYILLQPLNGKEEQDKMGQASAECNVRICITIYNRDRGEGRKQLLHLTERLRRDLVAKRIVGKTFALKLPLEWLIYPDDNEGYHLAELSTEWSLPATEIRQQELFW